MRVASGRRMMILGSFATQIEMKTGLVGAALIALMFGVASPASAAATMCNTGTMAKDDMSGDDMAMSEDMSDDGMAKDDMAKDDMAMEEDMSSGDTMASDDMAKDDMAMDETMSSDEMMMADYTVMAGDSLWTIAAATLCDGDRYPEIVAANKDMLGNSMVIHPGQMLHIPGD